jgi:NAD(P)-dependent dehydrogenase (short-subunit alcohol dehydrogenase family)
MHTARGNGSTRTERDQRASAEWVGGEPSLEGRRVLVTGGAGGLGAAIARELANAGAFVAIGDLRMEAAEIVASELPSGRGRAVALDVADDFSVAEAVRAVVDDHGGIDVLVNNAGIDATAPFEEIPMEEWDRILAVNLRAPMVLCRRVFPLMRSHGGGHIVNIVSTAAKRAWANASAYHATKWGLLGLSHALHVEGREHGIRVTALIAGGMRTPFLLDRFPDLDVGLLQDPGNVARAVRFVLLQPEGTVIPELLVLPTHESSWP